MDLTQAMKSKSDQLNAEDIAADSIIVRIISASIDESGRVSVQISGGYQPWKPAKCMIRALAKLSGSNDSSGFEGSIIELYREPSVKWAGKEEGGIRVCGSSLIATETTLMAREQRAVKKPYKIKPLIDPDNAEQWSKISRDDQVKIWKTLSADIQASIKEALK